MHLKPVHLKLVSAQGARRAHLALLAALLVAAALLTSTPAQAAPVPLQYITFNGNKLVPWGSSIVIGGDDSSVWYDESEPWVGPRGYTYRMYEYKGSGQCLDVQGGAATAGAELTTSPCQWSRNSQWWSTDGGTLTPWHAAGNNMVASLHEFGFLDLRFVLAPRLGPDGAQHQRTFQIVKTQIPH